MVLSLLLHGLLALTLVFTWKRSAVPLGVARQGSEVVDFIVSSAELVAPAKKKFVKNLEKADVEPLRAAEKTAALLPSAPAAVQQQLGFVEGERSNAQLGSAQGTVPSEKDYYTYELRTLIQQKLVYPQISTRLREAGRVIVRFRVLRDGRIEAVGIKSASTYSRLNEAAVGLVRGIEKFKPFPRDMLHDQASLEIVIPIEYVLN